MKSLEEILARMDVERMEYLNRVKRDIARQDAERIMEEYRRKTLRQQHLEGIPCTGIRINATVWAAGKSQEPGEIFSLKPVTDKDQREKLAEVCTHISVNGTTIF